MKSAEIFFPNILSINLVCLLYSDSTTVDIMHLDKIIIADQTGQKSDHQNF